MKVISHRPKGSEAGWRSGVVVGDRVVDGSEFGWPETVRRLLEVSGAALPTALTPAWAAAASSAGMPAEETELGPPVPDPQKILAVGLNYGFHASESGRDVPTSPELFAKFPNCLVGDGFPVQIPASSTQVDYEGELAVIIGRRSRNLSKADALAAVAGYAVMNDISARDLQRATSQWTSGKAPDTFAPLGPGITPRDDIPDVQDLELTTELNGQRMQHASTSEMAFSVVDLLVFISGLMTLEPGDIISTGTPDGVGMARTPPLYMQPGDVVSVEIAGLGRITNPVIAPIPAATSPLKTTP